MVQVDFLFTATKIHGCLRPRRQPKLILKIRHLTLAVFNEIKTSRINWIVTK